MNDVSCSIARSTSSTEELTVGSLLEMRAQLSPDAKQSWGPNVRL